MKRDPRLRRGGERRAPRHLHGLRFDPATIARRRIYAAFGMSRGAQAWAERSARVLVRVRAEHDAFVEQLRRVAETVSRDLARDLPAGLSVEFDDSPLLAPPRTGRLSGPGERGGWLYSRLTDPQPRVPYASYPPEWGTGPLGERPVEWSEGWVPPSEWRDLGEVE